MQPGHIIKFTSENIKLRKWYNLNSLTNNTNNKPIIYAKLRDYFDIAVKRRMISDVDLGVFLSGGLDSSLIVSSLAE